MLTRNELFAILAIERMERRGDHAPYGLDVCNELKACGFVSTNGKVWHTLTRLMNRGQLTAVVALKRTKRGGKRPVCWFVTDAGRKAKDDALACLQRLEGDTPKPATKASGAPLMARHGHQVEVS